MQLVGNPERSELDPIGAERVRLNDVGTRADVLLMHPGDELGPRDIERLEALVDENTLGVQHRSHRAVTNEDAIIKGLQKGLGHVHVSSLSHLNVSASMSMYDRVTMSKPIERTLWRTESVNS